MNTQNYDVVSKYFDLVQNEIKKLISQDKEIKPNQVDLFNNEIFNQPDEIRNQIHTYIDNASANNLDIKKVAKEIYNKFKLQVKNNLFNQKDSQPVPNKLMGEKHIKSFDSFVNESSHFHSMYKIDEILDKIKASGYENLEDSDKAILLNYSKDDEDIHNIILKMNDLTKEFIKLKKKLEVVTNNDSDEVKNKVMKEWLTLNSKMSHYENMLRYLYQIEDVRDIWSYQQKHNIYPE